MKSKILDYGGVLASAVLIIVGVAAIVIGAGGHSEVGKSITREQITGSPDMTPAAIKKEIAAAGLKNVPDVPTCSVANVKIDSGARAKCFAKYMRIHALEATGGRTYSQMGQYLTASGKETSDKAAAAVDPKTKQPVTNHARDVWVTETALSTALNTSFFAQQVALFSVMMGIALLLTGIGFLVQSLRSLRKPPAPAVAAGQPDVREKELVS